jgi:predicted Zn-dependent protease
MAGRSGLATRQRAYFDRLEGMVFGEDPRQGFFDGDQFFHPGLAFQMAFPSGWKRQNGRAAILAASADDQAALQVTLLPASDRSPAEIVAGLASAGRIAESRGGSETIGGFAAWVGRVAVPRQDGTQAWLAMVVIRRSPEQVFQVLGRSAAVGDAHWERVLATARSFRALTDPARLNVAPNRLRIKSATSQGSFDAAIGALGKQAVDLETSAIVNGRARDEVVRPGERLKLVVAGSR